MNATSAKPGCPSCGSTSAACLGPLPAARYFAGRALETALAGGFMYRCADCALGYRYPRLSKVQLDALYMHGSAATWEAAEIGVRQDWVLAREAILARQGPACSVLDVGCFEGGFLATLGGACDKAGVEIHAGAASRATAAGVRILGSDFDCLKSEMGRFSAVTAFDVIEHVEDPKRFLRLLAGMLKPGGTLILSTGNLDSWSWRLMRNQYWYSAIPEHISYLGDRWFRVALRDLPLRPVALRRFAHKDMSFARKMAEIAANLLYRVAPAAVQALRRLRVGSVAEDDVGASIDRALPPSWMSAADHILVVMEKVDLRVPPKH